MVKVKLKELDCLLEAEKISKEQYEIIVDLDATAPLRTVHDIRNCVELLERENISNVITGMTSRKSPYFNLVEINAFGFVELSTMQS